MVYIIYVVQDKRIPGLCDLHDLSIMFPDEKPYDVRDLAHFSGVGVVLHRSRTAYHSNRYMVYMIYTIYSTSRSVGPAELSNTAQKVPID